VDVESPTFGTLALKHVEDGTIVTEDEPIGEVEAMKVFFRITAPCDGVVTWMAELGDVVGQGDVLAEIV